ncbi:Carbamoyl-phosphate synthase small chain [hydrothermal vent metagenome]|uniref:carbamoyl-phosphate synthase (glutamine-hydrolyzing) n=1 Tax=hydrothermal vent metagenome TaxID=652676 RepID=A0A3B0TC08_9ZZZZ
MTNLQPAATSHPKSGKNATPRTPKSWSIKRPTALLVLADGTVIEGQGAGAIGAASAEVCFNTAMTGYQEILTDLSYASQIITFTFPHIGNVGTNAEDTETAGKADATGALGAVFRAPITAASNYRAARHLDDWLKARNIIAITGADTRALATRIRENGMPNAVIAHAPDGQFDLAALKARATAFAGIEGADLAGGVTTAQTYAWDQTPWAWGEGFGQAGAPQRHIVVIDYGAKSNILRALAGLGCRVTVVSARTNARDIVALAPDGVMLTNGPGDPAATGAYALPILQDLITAAVPIFGICLGHQLLALALGAATRKMHQGHHGANHPVVDLTTGKVEITSMNHGFTVASDSLPDGVRQTHASLFDGTNCGLAVDGKPVFSVQHHPEASPGPHDSHYLFDRFMGLVDEFKA